MPSSNIRALHIRLKNFTRLYFHLPFLASLLFLSLFLFLPEFYTSQYIIIMFTWNNHLFERILKNKRIFFLTLIQYSPFLMHTIPLCTISFLLWFAFCSEDLVYLRLSEVLLIDKFLQLLCTWKSPLFTYFLAG